MRLRTPGPRMAAMSTPPPLALPEGIEDTKRLVLEQLRLIRADQAATKDDIREINALLTRIEEAMQSLITHPFVPEGKIKTFGPVGPKYAVGKPLRQLPDGDWLIAIHLLESGEDAEYKLTSIQGDPDAV